jgi:hypothetical protein
MGEMTARWVWMLVVLTAVSAALFAVLVRSPLETPDPRAPLVGTWAQDRTFCGVPRSCGATLQLGGTGRFKLVAYHITERGRWTVTRPGVMRWDTISGDGPRRPTTWSYVVHDDTLQLVTAFMVVPARFNRVASP